MAKNRVETIVCEKCAGKWFEKVIVSQYPLGAVSVIGQDPTPVQDLPAFHFLRCFTCGHVMESDVYRMASDPMNQIYDEILVALNKRNGKFTGESIASQVL